MSLTFASSLQAKSLESDSPFLPPGYSTEEAPKPPPVVAAPGQIAREIEFRGLIQMGGKYQFSIYDKKTQRSYWIRAGSNQEGIGVNNFNPADMSVNVTKSGRSERISLATANDRPMTVATVTNAATREATSIPGLPPNLQNKNESRRAIPRRRVILPSKK